jgi:F-type H+-transporting ATPase subunit beta
MAESNGNGQRVGKVEEVTGVVVDVAFPDEDLPEIYHALKIEVPEGDGRNAIDLVLEVQQHLGDDRVKAVAMDATDGLRRGDQVVDTCWAIRSTRAKRSRATPAGRSIVRRPRSRT